MYEITIVADTNDADYITAINKITQDDLDTIKPLIKAISEFKPYEVIRARGNWTHNHNYPYGDGEFYPREDLSEKHPEEIYTFSKEVFEVFEEFIPFGEHGFHSIESIEITPFIKKTKLL